MTFTSESSSELFLLVLLLDHANQHNNTQHNDTQHCNKNATFCKMTLGKMTLDTKYWNAERRLCCVALMLNLEIKSIEMRVIMLNVVKLSVVMMSVVAPLFVSKFMESNRKKNR